MSCNKMASSSPLSKANTSFALALFKTLSDEDKTANIFYSPFSISSALAMVMLGARGNTAAQMSEVLCFTEPEQTTRVGEQQSCMQVFSGCLQRQKPQRGEVDVHANFAELLRDLKKHDAAYTLSVANRLYGEKSYQFVEAYLKETKKYYSAELEAVDFTTNSEAARLKINGWVEERTQGKIKDLLAPPVVDSSTRLVLVNAIYFKGQWQQKFQEGETVDAEFRINKNDTKPVKMMRQKSKFPLVAIPEATCKIVEMPYKGKDLSMLILLPNEIEDDTTGLEKLEKRLTYKNFTEWTRPDRMVEVEVEVSLPRFKMEEKYDLNEVLIKMGMVDAFDVGKSNFSGMSPANNLYLSKVVHKAFVEVNEEGTEAAAATGAIMNERSAMIPIRFIADHPFLLFIRHNPSNSVLFGGRFCSPE